MTGPSIGRPLRVVLWGTGDRGKPRVRLLEAGLRARGVELVECRADLWSGIADKSQIGAARWLARLLRLACSYPRLLWRYLRLPAHDWVLLCYPAIPDVFVIRPFARLRGAGVAMDWFLSAYDTVVQDRRLVGRRNPAAWLIKAIERLAVRLPDRVFLDTRAHARRLEALFGLPPGRCGAVWVGAEDGFFAARARPPRSPGRPLKVLFYGQLIPLHGVSTIIAAARLLENAPIDWLVIGRGQESERVRGLLAEHPLPRLRWLEWVDYAELPAHIAAADVCLGIFGRSDKAASVIPNKIFQAVAAGSPVLTRDSPAIREFLDPCGAGVHLVPPDDPEALAAALRGLLDASVVSPRPASSFDAEEVGRQLLQLLDARHAA